jgi:hypothetical protein
MAENRVEAAYLRSRPSGHGTMGGVAERSICVTVNIHNNILNFSYNKNVFQTSQTCVTAFMYSNVKNILNA